VHIRPKDFRVPQGEAVDLARWPTRVEPYYASRKAYRETLEDHVTRLRKAQELLYAGQTHALLLVFQGMDTAGKDGAIAHVMSGVNPQGCEVASFKQPSAEELRHDFLWRVARRLPERGRIGIFNRSHYEDVLVVRVHPELLEHQGLPARLRHADTLWQHRYRSIVGFESHLARNGTVIVKFFLHLSAAEQRQRLLERVNDPAKNWKLSPADIAERPLWDRYQKAYADAIAATSTEEAPWYVVPADDKPNARLIISQIVVHTLERLDLHLPKVDAAQRRALKQVQESLAAEGG
jgi:PPK2 family polyphosphate:nucleotide phosphotransferase